MKGVEREHKAHAAVSGRSRLAAAMFSAYLLTSACTHSAPPPAAGTRPAPQSVVSAWPLGSCEVSSNRLTYRRVQPLTQSSVVLDAKVSAPSSLLCSDRFTVILSERWAVVSLGADSVLRGTEMLGSISGRFMVANSYSLNITEPSAESIVAARLDGSILVLDTAAGNRWRIDLSDPREWRIY